ncbi:CCA tRNA nucleotidyltransferase, mitochondrial [Coemansia biformis]|uniref:CCA tRNA nucleotidyltransferase, mitochondrial n=1 Tax=Coemansia biformis TaxID=1286918 RepID=A0A9W8CY53_9FUNG|nr:CCA tRNA nucleotidyltransferase, mitochondrial [Coemansia biformis]
MAVELTPKEEDICALLLRVADAVHEGQPGQPRLTLRVAGGWVRDKLMGLESHDLDIAVDHMSGYDLAQHVNKYLSEHGYPVRSIAKISQNPERSKHLETANTSILGQLVDMVNLRSETYGSDSRIPQVVFGTPLEDALRRDITINALFYNIHTRQVEDFSEKGLSDLRAGIVRTPLEPRQTFSDDPLRVLRVLRFASRFDYRIDDATAAALGDPITAGELDRKISRERVGIELDKMAAGPRPLLSVQMILRFGLYDVVFRGPPKDAWIDAPAALDVALAGAATEQVLRLLDDAPAGVLPAELASVGTDPQLRRLLVLAAYTYPMRAVAVRDGKRTAPLAFVVVRDGLKLSKSDGEAVAALHALAPRIAGLAAQLCSETPPSRRSLGLLVREAGPRWTSATLFAAAASILQTGDVGAATGTYAAFARAVVEAGVADAFDLKYLVDGRDAAAILGIKAGPRVKTALERVMEWQLDNPCGTRSECEEYIRSSSGTLAESPSGE